MVNLKLGSYCHTVLLEYMQVQSILTEILQIENCWLLRFAMNCKHRWNRFLLLVTFGLCMSESITITEPKTEQNIFDAFWGRHLETICLITLCKRFEILIDVWP